MQKEQVTYLKNYEDLLIEIRSLVDHTKDEIANLVERKKVEMAWQVGKLIAENISNSSDSNYGKTLFDRLEGDLAITKTVLYKMHGFYKVYPEIPSKEDGLNWTHYRVLSSVKIDEERFHLENLVILVN